MNNIGDEKAATLKKDLLNKRICKAWSSLESMSFLLDDGSGLLIKAGDAICLSICSGDALPAGEDAVCKVDWSWIESSLITDVTILARSVNFVLNPSGPLKIDLQTWQNKPFLAFMPYKPARI